MRILLLLVFSLIITACGGGGDGGSSSFRLSVNIVTPSQVELNWDQHPDAISYEIRRNNIYLYHTSSNSFIDRTIEPGIQYCYVIYYSGIVSSKKGRSNEVCITTQLASGWIIETIDAGANPSLSLDEINQPHVSYRNTNGVMHAYKTNGSWYQSLVDNNSGNYGDTDIVVDQFGAVRLSYYDDVNKRLMYANNAIGIWNTEEIVSWTGNSVTSLNIDSASNNHIIYQYLLDINYMTDSSGSWQTEKLDSGQLREAKILVDATGIVHVAYTTDGLNGCTLSYINNMSGTWQQQFVTYGSICGVAIDIDLEGNIHLAYTQNNSLMHAHNTSGSWQSEWLDNNLGKEVNRGRVGLAIDNLNNLHIAYQDYNSDLKYITDKSGIWEWYFLDNSSIAGADPSIAVDTSGKVNIVYIDDTDTGDKVVKLVTRP
ncbi:MAG: hypothetical protein P8Y24_01005 [Gammaproteobacteria bacterium]